MNKKIGPAGNPGSRRVSPPPQGVSGRRAEISETLPKGRVGRSLLGLIVALILAAAPTLSGQSMSAAEILERVDRNAVAGNKIIVSTMTVQGRRDSRTIRAKSWIEGDEKSFTEYLEPPREKGVKMLKLGDQLWTYAPSTDRTISISGHLLLKTGSGTVFRIESIEFDAAIPPALFTKASLRR